MERYPERPGLLMTLAQKVDPKHAAVLVVDVQNDFVAEGGWADRAGLERWHNEAAARRVPKFLLAARQAGVPVIFVQSTYDDIYVSDPMLERNLRRGLTAPRCVSGTWGAEFFLVEPEPGEQVIRKHRYSAFVETELHTVLRRLGVKTLILTGVYTEGCVESTARHGYFLDYYVVMVDDCCGTTSEKIHRQALDRCERHFGIVALSEEIAAIWEGAFASLEGGVGARSAVWPGRPQP